MKVTTCTDDHIDSLVKDNDIYGIEGRSNKTIPGEQQHKEQQHKDEVYVRARRMSSIEKWNKAVFGGYYNAN